MDEKSECVLAMQARRQSFVPHRICWPAYWQRVDTAHSIASWWCQLHADRL